MPAHGQTPAGRSISRYGSAVEQRALAVLAAGVSRPWLFRCHACRCPVLAVNPNSPVLCSACHAENDPQLQLPESRSPAELHAELAAIVNEWTDF